MIVQIATPVRTKLPPPLVRTTSPYDELVLCFAGSLRADSYNRLLPWAAEAAPEGMTIETFDLVPIPLYNQDLDVGNGPELVARFREAISRANGLLIATPESSSGDRKSVV